MPGIVIPTRKNGNWSYKASASSTSAQSHSSCGPETSHLYRATSITDSKTPPRPMHSSRCGGTRARQVSKRLATSFPRTIRTLRISSSVNKEAHLEQRWLKRFMYSEGWVDRCGHQERL